MASKHRFREEVKVITMESGKTTFIRQIKSIYGEGSFSEEERVGYRGVIFSNVMKGAKILCEARRRLQIPFENPANESTYHIGSTLLPEEFQQYVMPLKALWVDSGIQATFKRRNEFQLSGSTSFFMQNINTLGQVDYNPSNEHIMRSRKATRGIEEYQCNIGGVPYRFVDVGGTRSQRQKWFQVLDEVAIVLLMVESSGFDKCLLEDRVTNRIVDSVNVFDTIVNMRCFRHVPVVVLFNNTDALKEKIKYRSIKDYIPDFHGDPHKLKDVQDFLVQLYDSVRQVKSSDFLYHFISSVDTDDVKATFDIVRGKIQPI